MSNIDTFLLFDANFHASFKNDVHVHYFSCKIMSCFNQISTFESIILFIDAKICKKVFIWSILHCQRSTNDIKALKSNYHFMLLKKVYTGTLKSDFVIKSCFIYLPTFVIRAFLHLTTCNHFLKNALFVFYFNISI